VEEIFPPPGDFVMGETLFRDTGSNLEPYLSLYSASKNVYNDNIFRKPTCMRQIKSVIHMVYLEFN